jgi:NH3-dependent NAD+ synthetase
MNKASSRGLRPHQSDEADLVATWSKIDDILRQLENNVDPETMIEKGMDSLVVHKVVRLLQETESQKESGLVLQAGKTMNLIRKAQEAEASSLS